MLSEAQRPYRPWGSAEEIFYRRDRQLVVSGPAGTGKSRAILEKIHYLCLKYPGLRVLMLRKTRKRLTDSALTTFEEHVLPEGSPICKGADRETRSSYQYPNGSRIVIAGLDDKEADKVMSTEWDLIYIQEGIEISEEVFEKAEMRLRNGKGPYHQIIVDTNPGPPTHWLLKRCQDGRSVMIHTHHTDNPRFYDHAKGEWTPEGEEYLRSLDAKRGHLRDRYFLGKWVQPEGARWPDLDERIHGFRLRERFPHGIPQSWPIILGVDYGLRAPYCALWIAVDHDGDYWLFRERYKPGLRAWEQAKEIRSSTGEGEAVSRIRMDPAMWQDFPAHEEKTDRSAADYYRQIFAEDERFGPIEKGFNRSRMLGQQTLDYLFDYSNPFPDLHIETELCPNAWAELTGAVWSDKERKEDIDEKCPDHAITALIYALHGHTDEPEEAPPPIPTQEEARRQKHEEIRKRDEREIGQPVRRLRL